jgi:hypothetical protein
MQILTPHSLETATSRKAHLKPCQPAGVHLKS